jgi:hypothetical protein
LATQRKPPLGLVDSLRVGFYLILKRLFPLHNLSIANLREKSKRAFIPARHKKRAEVLSLCP